MKQLDIKVTLYRKLLVGFLASMITIGWVTFLFFGIDQLEQGGFGFIEFSVLIAFFVVPCILLYGIPVSILIEYMFTKKGFSTTISYIVVHTVFGAASYFLFWELSGALYGIVAACMFACIDRITVKVTLSDKMVIAMVVIPIGLYTLLAIFFGS